MRARRRTVFRSAPDGALASARENLNPITVFPDRGHAQREGIEDCPPGAVFVIDSRKDARAASAGPI